MLSTYELGHQPLGLAIPAGVLRADGHEVEVLDLSTGDRASNANRLSGMLERADMLAVSVPMHTAMQLAVPIIKACNKAKPDLPIVLYGLYAHLGQGDRSPVRASACIRGDDPAPLAELAASNPLELTRRSAPELARSNPLELARWSAPELARSNAVMSPSSPLLLPARDILPPLSAYARLDAGGKQLLSGAAISTIGCSRKCLHCPVPIVYQGRSKAISLDLVMADIDQLARLGARHISFADADFLSRPSHAKRVMKEFGSSFPELTFDLTTKVSHLLANEDLIAEMANAGCLFVTSAFESTSQKVLDNLAKGHTRKDMPEAVKMLRAHGIEPRPSFVPFTPWSTLEDLADLLDLVAELDLVGNVDAVQYAIELLVPPESLLMENMANLIGPYDPARLTWLWDYEVSKEDPKQAAALRELQETFSSIAENAVAEQATEQATEQPMEQPTQPPYNAYLEMREALAQVLSSLPDRTEARRHFEGANDERALQATAHARSQVPPRLTESWFCCAEPTGCQTQANDALAMDLFSSVAPASAVAKKAVA